MAFSKYQTDSRQVLHSINASLQGDNLISCAGALQYWPVRLFVSLLILSALPTASLQDSVLHHLALSTIRPFLEPNLAEQKALCCHTSDSPVLSSQDI